MLALLAALFLLIHFRLRLVLALPATPLMPPYVLRVPGVNVFLLCSCPNGSDSLRHTATLAGVGLSEWLGDLGLLLPSWG